MQSITFGLLSYGFSILHVKAQVLRFWQAIITNNKDKQPSIPVLYYSDFWKNPKKHWIDYEGGQLEAEILQKKVKSKWSSQLKAFLENVKRYTSHMQ